MKNEYYALNLSWETECHDKETMMASIRREAHILDLAMQRQQKTVDANNTERIVSFRKKLKIYQTRFDDSQPDFKWAVKIADLYQSYVNSNESFKYPSETVTRLNIPETEFHKLITCRQSIRKFTGEADERLLKKVIEYGVWAPTNCNLQAIRYIIIKDAEKRKQIRNCGNHSTVCVIADLRDYSDNDIDCPYHDSGAAIQNILLACHYYGLGACYVSDIAVNNDKSKALLNVASYEKITAIIWIGQYIHVPIAPARRNIDEIVSFV